MNSGSNVQRPTSNVMRKQEKLHILDIGLWTLDENDGGLR